MTNTKINKVSGLLACYIESQIDEYIVNLIANEYNRKRRFIQYLRAHKPNKADCTPVIETCLNFIDELDGVLVDKDPELIEGYSYLTLAKIKKLREFIDSIYTDATTYCTRTRKKKKRTPEQMLKKFQYMETTPNGKVSSFDPVTIFSSKSFIAYNTKTGDLYYYITNDKFGVTGTTLNGFDEENSYCSRVGRKGISFVTTLTEGTSGRSKNY